RRAGAAYRECLRPGRHTRDHAGSVRVSYTPHPRRPAPPIGFAAGGHGGIGYRPWAGGAAGTLSRRRDGQLSLSKGRALRHGAGTAVPRGGTSGRRRCGAEAVDRGAGRADRGGNFLRTSGAPGDLIKSEENTKGDRKSTRLNSSHVKISYAVFCLKKKTRTNTASIATDARTTERPSV